MEEILTKIKELSENTSLIDKEKYFNNYVNNHSNLYDYCYINSMEELTFNEINFKDFSTMDLADLRYFIESFRDFDFTANYYYINDNNDYVSLYDLEDIYNTLWDDTSGYVNYDEIISCITDDYLKDLIEDYLEEEAPAVKIDIINYLESY